MKYIKIFIKTIGLGCLAILTACFVFIIAIVCFDSYHESLASNPNRIIKKAGVEFPSYRVHNSYDNMERMSSCWNSYEYNILFDRPLDSSILSVLDAKVNEPKSGWSKSDNFTYKFQDGDEISIILSSKESTMNVEYMW